VSAREKEGDGDFGVRSRHLRRRRSCVAMGCAAVMDLCREATLRRRKIRVLEKKEKVWSG